MKLTINTFKPHNTKNKTLFLRNNLKYFAVSIGIDGQIKRAREDEGAREDRVKTSKGGGGRHYLVNHVSGRAHFDAHQKLYVNRRRGDVYKST